MMLVTIHHHLSAMVDPIDRFYDYLDLFERKWNWIQAEKKEICLVMVFL